MNGIEDNDQLESAPSGPVPHWEKRYPGRLKYELDALADAGVSPLIDEKTLAAGALSMEVDWQLKNGVSVCLRANFPDAYPHFRPQVFLISGLDTAPVRHRNPIDGNLCLLGRDTRQWRPSWTLRDLLGMQIDDALSNTGDEDPQGEPADYWWNSLNSTGSYCLIDSEWALDKTKEGTLLIGYLFDEVKSVGKIAPVVKAFVKQVRSSDGTVLYDWSGVLPRDLAKSEKQVEVPWAKSKETVYPGSDFSLQVKEIEERYPNLRNGRPHKLGGGLQFLLFALTYPSEVSFDQIGLGWTFIFKFGHTQDFKPPNRKKGKQKRLSMTVLPALRAGKKDIGCRVPAVAALNGKRVVVVGTGAVGAPVAIELARNGCSSLDLIEYDTVEPGNSIRWPLGASSWGQDKVYALSEFLEREYPQSEVCTYCYYIGGSYQPKDYTGDGDILDGLFEKADLVIDGSASHGVTSLLGERCRNAGVPLICLFSTPSLEGGAVVRHAVGGGCPNCLAHAWDNGEIKPPPGQAIGDNGLIQPPGCGERTFVGADYDLRELSLQAMRLAVDTLSGETAKHSLVQTLSFVDENGNKCLPTWRTDDLPIHQGCKWHC